MFACFKHQSTFTPLPIDHDIEIVFDLFQLLSTVWVLKLCIYVINVSCISLKQRTDVMKMYIYWKTNYLWQKPYSSLIVDIGEVWFWYFVSPSLYLFFLDTYTDLILQAMLLWGVVTDSFCVCMMATLQPGGGCSVLCRRSPNMCHVLSHCFLS